ncbi:tandem-95 repeat protein [bacterium]|nr:tandem-95 repeat protein [bacterium]
MGIVSLTNDLPAGVTAVFAPNPLDFTPTDNVRTTTLAIAVAPTVATTNILLYVRAEKNDQSFDFAVSTAILAILNSNQPPVAVADSYSTDEDTTRDVAAPGVLGNDTDADGDPLTAVLVDDVTQGSLTLNVDGSFSYTPAAAYDGPDSFTYQATDGTATSAVTTVSLTVDPVNDAPVVVASTPNVDEDGTLNVPAPGALAGAGDADGDTLTAILISDVSHGTLTFNPDGSYGYVPAANYNGSDSFSFAATDGTLTSSVATVTITVNSSNDAPVANNDSSMVPENSGETTIDVLANDTDGDGDPLTAALVDDVAHGLLTLNSDGSFSYQPDAGYFGPDSFTYQANDGYDTSTPATVSLSIDEVQGADDADLYAKGAALTVNWKAHAQGTSADKLKITGKLNPRGCADDLSGATLAILVNGVAVVPPQTLDARGSYRSPSADPIRASYRLSSAKGTYTVSVTGLDL